jgi:hypothetical protein
MRNYSEGWRANPATPLEDGSFELAVEYSLLFVL